MINELKLWLENCYFARVLDEKTQALYNSISIFKFIGNLSGLIKDRIKNHLAIYLGGFGLKIKETYINCTHFIEFLYIW